MNKTTEALKRVLDYVEQTAQFIPHDLDDEGIAVAAILREALADQFRDATKIVAEPVFKFLLGEGELEGCGFGEKPEGERGNYWWRKHLRKALAEPVKQEPLCEDEGCPHRGSPHICIDKTVNQEPVAILDHERGGVGAIFWLVSPTTLPKDTQLYATPLDAKAIRAEREWVDLTDEDRNEIETKICPHIDSHDFELIGYAYIAAFKEKQR